MSLITGNKVYLNNIQDAIELFLSNDGPLVSPPLLTIDFAKKGVLWKALGSRPPVTVIWQACALLVTVEARIILPVP
jgi:hypothetical protein